MFAYVLKEHGFKNRESNGDFGHRKENMDLICLNSHFQLQLSVCLTRINLIQNILLKEMSDNDGRTLKLFFFKMASYDANNFVKKNLPLPLFSLCQIMTIEVKRKSQVLPVQKQKLSCNMLSLNQTLAQVFSKRLSQSSVTRPPYCTSPIMQRTVVHETP